VIPSLSANFDLEMIARMRIKASRFVFGFMLRR